MGGQGWALTETFALGTTNTGAEFLQNPGSCGKPLPIFVDLCIKDPAGNKLPEGSRGEVCITGAMMMTGYLPDERLGEVVAICLWVDGDVSAKDLVASASKHLAKFKLPEEKYVFLRKEALPKGA